MRPAWIKTTGATIARGVLPIIALLLFVGVGARAQTITQTTVPDGLLQSPYSFQLSVSPGSASGWTITGGSLPPGLGIVPQGATGGLITGTPTKGGLYSFTVTATIIGAPNNPQQTFSLFIASSPLAITETSIPGAVQNASYSTAIHATGGNTTGPYLWSFAAGTNTQGLTIGPAPSSGLVAIISGRPPTVGTFPLTVVVTDAAGTSVQQILSLVVVGPLAIITTTLPNGAVNEAYSQTLALSGGAAPFTWSVSPSTPLPSGLTLSPGGLISGTPTVAQTVQTAFTVSDASQQVVTSSLTITINPILSITTTSLPSAVLGTAYSQTLAAAGGLGADSWSLIRGTLPAGLTLDPVKGVISGTPTVAGPGAAFTVQVLDAGKATALQTCTLAVNAVLTITTTSLPSGAVGVPYSQTFTAINNAGTVTWSLSPTAANPLPAGLTLSAGGVISGTPTAAGTSSFTVIATDTQQQVARQALTIQILPAAPTVTVTPTTATPAQQPPVTVSLSAAYPSDISGTIALTFASSVGGDDQLIAFSSGGRTVNFTIPANSTKGVFSGTSGTVALITGTVAGTITLTTTLTSQGATIAPQPAPVAIVIAPTPPVITSVVYKQGATGAFSVVVTGFSNTRDMTSGLFHFTPATVDSLAQSDITVPLTSAFSAWYANTASNAFGSEFTLTVPFTTTGPTTGIVAVTVTLTNSKGVSTTSNPANP